MRIAGQAYVLSAAIALVAMASRAEWINWPALGHVAAAVLAVGAGLLTLLALMALLIGIPTVIVIAVTQGLLKLFPVKPAEGPQA